MRDDKDQEIVNLELLNLFLEDLKRLLVAFKGLLQSIDKPDFLQSSHSLFIGICHALIAAAKIVRLKELEKFIKNFEDNFYRLLEGKKSFGKDEKNLLLDVYHLLEKMSLKNPKDLLNYIPQQSQDFQQIERRFFQEEILEILSEKAPLKVSSIAAAAAEVSWPTPEKKMIELFKVEIEKQVKILSQDLLIYQSAKSNLKLLEPLMRAAHSIKGAARIFAFEPIVQLAHVMEDCFAFAQEGKIIIDENLSDLIFSALDTLGNIVNVPPLEINAKLQSNSSLLYQLVEEFKRYDYQSKKDEKISSSKDLKFEESEEKKLVSLERERRVLRLAAHHLDRLMGLAAESMVESRWLSPFCDSLLRLKNTQRDLLNQFEVFRNHLEDPLRNNSGAAHFHSLRSSMLGIQNDLSNKVSDLEMFITRHSNLVDRLYAEVIESRMRPFADGIEAFPRMVWESARRWNIKARLEISGKSTLVDRDILEKLQTPLSHLLRNAIDHGIGKPEERIALGKLPEGVIQLDAFHRGGMLTIKVSDDGRGINLDALRKKIVDEKIVSPEKVATLTEKELLDFLFTGFFDF